MMIKCPKCGLSISSKIKTCFGCGYSVDKISVENCALLNENPVSDLKAEDENVLNSSDTGEDLVDSYTCPSNDSLKTFPPIIQKIKSTLSGFFRQKRKANLAMAPVVERKPLLLFAEMKLEHTSKCFAELRRNALITDSNGHLLSYFEAISVYYSRPEGALPWTFQIKDIELVREDKTYKVIGDGIVLGCVSYSKYDDSSVRMLDELIYIDKIDHLKVEIKGTSYFFLTEEEYSRYVAADPFQRGFPSWAHDVRPDITLFVYFEDGVIDLARFNTGYEFPDPDKILNSD